MELNNLINKNLFDFELKRWCKIEEVRGDSVKLKIKIPTEKNGFYYQIDTIQDFMNRIESTGKIVISPCKIF